MSRWFGCAAIVANGWGAAAVQAQSRCCITEASGYGGGAGTQADPYQVCLPTHLDNVRNNLAAFFVQTGSIDMAAVNHVPIGTLAAPFTGTYDGRNYLIENLSINNMAATPGGLFGMLDATAVVTNVYLSNVNLNASNSLGALAGVNSGTITNCSTQGAVNGRDNVGGLVGQNIGGDIKQSLAIGIVQGRNRVGGLVGACSAMATIEDSYSRAGAAATNNEAAGLCAAVVNTDVTRCYSSGPVAAGAAPGGLIAAAGGGVAVADSFWDVQTSGQAASAGGAGRTTAQMRSQAVFDPPWDFVAPWTILEGVDYPRLLTEPTAPPPVAEQDLDQDGVLDGMDYCPNTIVGVPVGPLGCPDPSIPFDDDLDGDVDGRDLVAAIHCSAGVTPAAETCVDLYDVDGSGTVDMVEWAALQLCYSGPDVPGNAACLAAAGWSLTPVPAVQQKLAACTAVLDPPEARYSLPDRHLQKVTLADPLAVCNDGTPAVMYVHKAPDGSPDAEKWVIYFKGGGGCFTYPACEGRWCGVNPPFDATLMSSRWVPDSRQGTGIFLPCEPNSLAKYNHVWLEYCSSDNWSGTNGRVVITDDADPTQKYSMYFNGHFIVEAALAVLESGAVSDNGAVVMPSLLDASETIWTGSSAGGGGMERHLDYVAARYAPIVSYGVRDAGPGAGITDLTGVVPNTGGRTWEDFNAEHEVLRLEGVTRANLLWAPFVDASCAALSPDPDQCSSGEQTTLNHITTPFFLRLDLRDPVANGTLLAIGLPLDAIAYASRLTLLAIADIQMTAIEAPDIPVAPGVFGPHCAQHEGVYIDKWFYDNTVEDAMGVPVNFHDALRAWLDGQPVVIVDSDDLLLRTSICP